MITVRFDTGFSVQYNDLNWVKFANGMALLYKNKTAAGYSAAAPLTALIEVIDPCRAYNPTIFSRDGRMEAVEKELRGLKNRIPARTKKANRAK